MGLGCASCYECVARAERKSTLQGSGLVRTACRAVCLRPYIARGRDALSNDWCESTVRFERLVEQALALATEPGAKREARSVLCHTCQ